MATITGTVKQLVISILYDETMSRLPDTTKHKDFVFQELKKIGRVHFNLVKKDAPRFTKAYELANEAWLLTQNKFLEHGLEFSNVLFMKFLREEEPWLVSHFDLSQKRIDKLEQSYDLTKHGLRTKKILRIVLESIDIVIAQDNYRREHEL